MSVAKIAKAFRLNLLAFNAASEELPTGFENVNFVPPDDTPEGAPYQLVFFVFADPENPTMGDGHYRQRGYMQIRLAYPSNKGAGDARRRADAIRAHYFRGLSLTADGVTTTVEKTPEIGLGSNVGARFELNVFVRFYADIFGA